MSEKRKEMKLKASKLLLISLVAVIFSLAGALAANCGGATTCHCGDTVTSSYNLNGNMNCVGNALVIGANGITLNCKGYTISGNGGGYGVYVAAKGNVIIKNCKINSFETGVWPSGSYNVEVNNVSVSNCVVFGVNVDVSSDIKLYNVNLSYNHAGLGASGCFSVINATLNNNNQIGIVTDGGQGCTVLIKNVEVSYNQAGISLYHFDNTLFSNVTVIGNGQFGIILNDANGNIIENSYIANNQYAGVYVYTFSSGNIIRSSNISSNSNAGILLSGSANTQITNSTISGNTNAGISFATGTDNNQIIYHNNILGSPIKINFSSCPSSGTNLAALFGGGNFWGHSSAPLFISSSDTNCAGLTDSQAYNSLDGWRLGEPSNQDTDNDGIQDADDNCPQNYNPDQLDSDFDGKGDLCDPCPFSSPDNCDSLYTRAANINPTTGATLSNGEVWLNIPAGAVNTDTSISIQRGGQSNFNVVNDLGGGIAIYEYVFGPRGKNFNSLYTLKFAYNPGEYLCDIGFCSVWFCRPGESRETCWEPVDTDYSEIGWLTIKDSHFSEFAPMQKIESAVIQSTIIGQGETGDVGFAAITPAEITSFQYSVIYPKGLIFRGYSLSSRINPYWAAAINVTDAGCAEGSECEFNQVNIYVSTKPGGTIYGTEGSLIDLQFDAAPDTASGAYNLTVSNILMLDANSQPIETGYVSNGVAYVDNNPPELTVHGIPQSWQNNAALIGIECDDCAKIEYGVSSLPICFATSKYTAPVQITSNKWFCWRGEDAAGNTASGTSKIDYFDSDAPVTSASIEGQITDGKYYNKATVIISTENDMSGVETTVYCVDNTDECDPLTTYNMQFDVNNEGVNFVRYYSIDNAGNTEEIKSARFEITKEVLPEEHLTITTSGTQGNNGWFTSIVGWIVEACSNFGVRGLNSSIELIGGSGGPVCGNSFVETGEQCDDGNTVSGDGCSSTCTIEQAGCSATGGIITQVGNYKIHTFTSSGTFNVASGCNAEVLVVAGGGGGGVNYAHGSGGGAGGLIYYGAETPVNSYREGTSFTITSGNHAVIVGNGGAAAASGENSVFDTLTAIGGGYGGNYFNPQGGNGGSGGGGPYNGNPGAGTIHQGYNGGRGGNGNAGESGSGGGGGAGSAGVNGTNNGGNGGIGISYAISGTDTYYAGGGGGSAYSGGGGVAGAGGLGGGGAGSTADAVSGTPNTGGGGGGGERDGTISGAGGSGIVIIRYLVSGGGPVCGNSVVETGEQCDDGNTVSGDGCSATCTIEAVPTCGAAGSDTEGMIGYWEMEENTGASTADSSGLGHTLTGNGRTFPAWTTLGKVTNALSNAGSWETAAGTGDSSFNFNGEHIITVEAWVKFVSWNWGGWAYQLGNQPWSFYANGAAPNTGKAVMYYDGVLGATNSNTVMDLNTWYYIVSTYDGANAILYINGNVDKTVPATGNMAASSTDLALGFGLDGIMDEVAIYNRALSLQDVQAHYSRSSAGNHYC